MLDVRYQVKDLQPSFFLVKRERLKAKAKKRC